MKRDATELWHEQELDGIKVGLPCPGADCPICRAAAAAKVEAMPLPDDYCYC